MKTSGFRSSCQLAFAAILWWQTAVTCRAQSHAKPAGMMDFLGAIQAGHERDALAMLEANTNLANARDDVTKCALLEAAKAGDVTLVKRLLELGADINAQGDTLMSGGSRNTALHWAIQGHHLEVCRVLLAAGADPNRMALSYDTPLHLAFAEDQEDIASLLLDYGSEPFLGKLFVNDETTPFELAITKSHGRLVPRMLGQESRQPLGNKSLQKPGRLPRQGIKTSAEVLSRRGGELLSMAAQRGEVEAVSALLRAGVVLNDAHTGPTLIQAYAIAANDNARSYTGVSEQLLQLQKRLEANDASGGDPDWVARQRAAIEAQEGSLSNRLAMMAPERWHQVLELLVDHGADYDAFAATALDDKGQANKLMARNKNVVQTRDGNGETLLHWAMRTDHPAMASFWIANGVPLEATNDAGETALHLAASAGNANQVRLLLAAKASTAVRDTNGWTPLEAAIQNQQADCIHLLLPGQGAAAHPERGPSQPLHAAAAAGNIAQLAALLETETNLEARNELGFTPLQLAVTKGHLGAAALLVDKGANLKVTDSAGNSLLHLVFLDHYSVYDRPSPDWLAQLKAGPIKAVCISNLTVGPYSQGPNPLLQGACFLLACGLDARVTNGAGETVLQWVTAGEDKIGRGNFFFDDDQNQMIRLLSQAGSDLEQRDADGNTVLHRYIKTMDVSGGGNLQAIIAAGADINATNGAGQTPLHLAAQKIPAWDLNDPSVGEPREAFQLLVYKKANVNARDNLGRTPLHVLAIANSSYPEAATRLLVAAGANPNLQDNEGMTPLHLIAGSSLSFKQDMVQYLLNVKADPNIQDQHGRTPAHLFLTGAWPWQSAGNCIQKLAAAGADFSIRDESGKTPLHYLAALGEQSPLFYINGVDRVFLAAKVDLQARDNEGDTPAIIAAKTGTKDVFDWLVKQGVDLDLTNHQGETARLLMAHHNEPFPRFGGNAETDLFQAVREDNLAAAAGLLKADPAQINQTNRSQQTPLRLAVMQERTDMIGLLESHGAVWDAGSAVLAGRTKELEKILRQNPEAAGMTMMGKGLLHIAAANNDLDSVRLLVAAKGGVNTADFWGLTPLGYALMTHHKAVEDFLRQEGAQEDIFDAVYTDDGKLVTTLLEQDKTLAAAMSQQQYSVLDAAVANGSTNALRVLLKHGVSFADDPQDPVALAASGNRPECLALLLRAGAKLDAGNRHGLSPLHWAAMNGATEAAEFLLQHKVKVNQPVAEADPEPGHAGSILGDTPLHLAVLCGETNMINLLLKAGADVNAANAAQLTPFDLTGDASRLSFEFMRIRLSLHGPLDNQKNARARMQKAMANAKAVAEILQAAGGKHSPNYSPFGRY